MQADPPKEGLTTKARVVSIHDGDTITVEVTKTINVRFLDCWAPELKGKDSDKGKASLEHLKTLIQPGDEVLVQIPIEKNLGKSLTLGRFLGTIWKDIDKDDKLDSISEEMVKSGHAKKDK